MNIGSSNKSIYDTCAYAKQLYESTSPLLYQLYEGKHEHCKKCIYDKFWRPYDLIDIDSELKNITRPQSRCDQFKYDPNCVRSSTCVSTFDKDVPVVFVPDLCPIVHNNIQKMTTPGYSLPPSKICIEPAGISIDDKSKYIQNGGRMLKRKKN